MEEELKNIVQSYASNSTIHSVNYIGDGKRSKSTRFFWIIALVLSVTFFGLYAFKAYTKWKINPGFSYRQHQRHVNEIPFPSVTVCSQLFARDNLADSKTFYDNNFMPLKFAENMTSKEANYLMSNLQATSNPFQTVNASKLVPNRTETNIVKLMNESFLNTNEILFYCSYRKLGTKCDRVFNRVLTDRSFCYSFNMEGFNTIFNNSTISKDFYSYKRTTRKSPSNINKLYNQSINDDEINTKWTLDRGFGENHELDEVPVAIQKNSYIRFGMWLNKEDANNLQILSPKIFRYQFHLPNEISTPLQPWEAVKFNELKSKTLTAKMFRTDEKLRMYSPEIRGCYFDGERSLKYFKTYTKNNCEYECLANFTLNECKCVKFSMPRDDKTPVCNETQTFCYFNAMNEFPKYDPITKGWDSCNCLKTCTDIKYQEINSGANSYNGKLDTKVFFTITGKNASDRDAFSVLDIRFSINLIEEEEMYSSYTLQNFISDTGGLLGLFMGCSLLSVIEILFFCSQIITKTVILYHKKFWNRNRVQNINLARIRPISTVSNNQYLRQLEQTTMDQIEQRFQQQQHNHERLEHQIDQRHQQFQQQLENYERQLRQMNQNITVIANFVQRQVRSQRS